MLFHTFIEIQIIGNNETDDEQNDSTVPGNIMIPKNPSHPVIFMYSTDIKILQTVHGEGLSCVI